MSTMFTALKGNFGGGGGGGGGFDDLDVIKMVGRANIEAAINLDSEKSYLFGRYFFYCATFQFSFI